MPLIGGTSLLRKECLTLGQGWGAVMEVFINEGIFKKKLEE